MISWMLVLISVGLISAVFGFGALAAAVKIVAVVLFVLAGVAWAHKPRRGVSLVRTAPDEV